MVRTHSRFQSRSEKAVTIVNEHQKPWGKKITDQQYAIAVGLVAPPKKTKEPK
jgi:hypothetical protein